MNSVTIAVLVGTLLSVAATYRVIGWIGASNWRLQKELKGDFARRITWVFGVAMYPFTWFLGFIVGGNFGGAYANKISEGTDISQEVLIPIGISIFVCSALFSILSALVSFVIVRSITRK